MKPSIVHLGLILALVIVGCGVKQTTNGESLLLVVTEIENTQQNEFVELYKCPCPDGRLVPEIRLQADPNIYFKSEGELSQTSEIRGRVVTIENLPVPNAIVSLYNTSISDTTDENGSYTLSAIPSGKINLIVSSDNYFGCSLPTYTIKHPQLLTASTIQLQILRAQLLKPIIYLYPEKEIDVSVQLKYQGIITHSYPKYTDSWKVNARPDGTLKDEFGRTYYALFWEGAPKKKLSTTTGFVVKGSETIPFLERTLDQLGLTEREANEFIMFWYPKMEGNDYNLIHFSTDEYLESAKLSVSPEPETVIRIMMVYRSLKTPLDIPLQILPQKPERKGFTLVEWGGTELEGE